ncbi:MAG: hypothetical protein ACO2PO_22625 [Candidatus Calescibacterium sp.]
MNMNTKTIKNNKDDINIIGIFCIVDDVLKNLGLKEDVRVQASNSEILTIAILAFLFFGGNFKKLFPLSYSKISLLKSLIQGF